MTRRKRQTATERVQTGVRIENRLMRVLKALALAELHDTYLGELMESMVHSALAGTPAFGGRFLTQARELAGIYGWPVLEAGHEP